jgi:hypothetical protein
MRGLIGKLRVAAAPPSPVALGRNDLSAREER